MCIRDSLMIGANPAVQIISNFGEMLSLKLCLIYLAAGVLALVLARLAYGKAKLEKVGDSMMFRTDVYKRQAYGLQYRL